MQYRKIEYVTSKTQNEEQDEACVEFLSKFLPTLLFVSVLVFMIMLKCYYLKIAVIIKMFLQSHDNKK